MSKPKKGIEQEITETGFRKRSGVVRIKMPAEAAFDLDVAQKTVANLVERLGCPTCFSGVDCRFESFTDFVADPAGRVAGLGERFGK